MNFHRKHRDGHPTNEFLPKTRRDGFRTNFVRKKSGLTLHKCTPRKSQPQYSEHTRRSYAALARAGMMLALSLVHVLIRRLYGLGYTLA